MDYTEARLKLYKVADRIERYHYFNDNDKIFPFSKEAKDIEDVIEFLDKKGVI